MKTKEFLDHLKYEFPKLDLRIFYSGMEFNLSKFYIPSTFKKSIQWEVSDYSIRIFRSNIKTSDPMFVISGFDMEGKVLEDYLIKSITGKFV